MAKSQETQTTNPPTSREIVGGCHCGAVRFKATSAPNTKILRCNCSICSMTGFEHLIVKHPQFKLISGEDQLTAYQFNTQKAKHLFCQKCGIKSFYQPRSHADSWSIHTHCIDGFNPSDWQYEDFDGQNWETAQTKL